MMPIQTAGNSSSLVEILEKILDKGVVIAGDIRIGLADVELLTIKIRLVVASVDKAREMGINWWEGDPDLSTKARRRMEKQNKKTLEQEKRELQARLAALELEQQ